MQPARYTHNAARAPGLRRSLGLLTISSLFLYTILVGANLFVIPRPEISRFSLYIMGLTLAGWLLARRKNWRWYATPLSGAILFWLLALGISLGANLDMWRRIAIGLWYVGLYVVVWYVLHDVIANRRLLYRQLVNALLIVGLVEIIFGFFNFWQALAAQWPEIQAGRLVLEPLRVGGMLVNPILLGTFLAMLLPLAFERYLSARMWLERAAMAAYILLAGLLLFLTFSRSPWIAAAAGLLTVAILFLYARVQLNAAYWRDWWRRQSRYARRQIVATAIIAGLSVIAGLVVFLVISTNDGRTLDWRTRVWEPALHIFAERPLTGYGLFTFGAHWPRFASIPPEQFHNHAHNIFLHVATELGLFGLAGLLGTSALVLRAMRCNWVEANQQQRIALAGSVGSAVAFGVVHLFDTPSLNPSVALTGLLAIILATAPLNPILLTGVARRARLPLLAGLGSLLLATGFWNNRVNQQYVNLLAYGIFSEDYVKAADDMAVIVSADPALAVTYAEQGLFYGMASAEGNPDAARKGIMAYERFIRLEPNYANVWANLAALYHQTGDHERALAAMQRSVELAPLSPALHYRLGQYLEARGQTAAARHAYERAVELLPALPTSPFWVNTPVQQAMNVSVIDHPDYEVAAIDMLDDTKDLPPLMRNDTPFGANLLPFSFLRQAVPRQFLPQVGYFEARLRPAEEADLDPDQR